MTTLSRTGKAAALAGLAVLAAHGGPAATWLPSLPAIDISPRPQAACRPPT